MLKSPLNLLIGVAVAAGFGAGGLCARQAGRAPSPGVSEPVIQREYIPLAKPAGIPSGTSATAGSPAMAASTQTNAFTGILKLQARRERESALEAMGRSLAVTNLAEAIRVAATIADHLDREAFLSGMVKVWAAQDPAAALAYCLEQDFSARCALVPQVIAEQARTQPEAALKALAGLPVGEVYDKSAEALFTAWSAGNPVEAARHLGAVKDGDLRGRVLDAFAGEWAANDPSAALLWAVGLENREEQAVAMSSALREYGRRHPREALDWAGKQMRGTSPLTGDTAAALLAEAGFTAPKEAFRTGLTLGNDPKVTEAMSAVTAYYAEDQPRALIEDFRKLTQSQQADNSSSILFALGASSSTVPSDLISSLPDAQDRQEAVNAYIQGLSLRDATLAKAWARGLPEGSLRDAALQSLQQSRGNNAGLNLPSPSETPVQR